MHIYMHIKLSLFIKDAQNFTFVRVFDHSSESYPEQMLVLVVLCSKCGQEPCTLLRHMEDTTDMIVNYR